MFCRSHWQEDSLWTPIRETDEARLVRAQQFLNWLFDRPEQNIAVVAHGGKVQVGKSHCDESTACS